MAELREGDHHDGSTTLKACAESNARWLHRAIELAARGRCGASPNPMVGAVVLDADGRVAGEGWHAMCGGPHAEVIALREAGDRARGGTLYVSLEPCSHHGRTPPCADAIVAAGISRVVVAARDPNPDAAGGVERLRAEGIEVCEGPGGTAARTLNRRWLVWAEERRPWVTAKIAMSLDGHTATRTGESMWITGEAARRRGLELREEHDAILVGVNTVLADDPRLTRRLGTNPGPPLRRIILDARLRTPADAVVVRTDPETTLVVTTSAADPDRRCALSSAGVEILEVPANATGRVDLDALLDALGRRRVAALLVEGGATVHGDFADCGLIDELFVFVAPLVIGGPGRPAIGGAGIGVLADVTPYRFQEVARHGEDLELHALRADRIEAADEPDEDGSEAPERQCSRA